MAEEEIKEEKKKKGPPTIEEQLKLLDKTYGKGSVIYGNQSTDLGEYVSTGSLELDIATGIGGIPVGGKLIEIIGEESTGKSTLTQTIMGNYQRKFSDKIVLLVDGENSLSKDYATKLGLDIDKLMYIQIDEHAGEGAYNKATKLIETGQIGLVVYDSYNSLQPKKIMDGEVGDNNLGLHARMLGTVVVKANADAVKYGTTSIFIGQIRQKIGVMFGSPDVTQGGNALKFYCHMRFKVSRSVTTDNSTFENGTKTGNLTKVEVFKNKMSMPFRKAEFNIIYGEGIDKYMEIINMGHDLGIFTKRGESLSIGTEKTKVEDFITLLKDNDALFEEYREQILKLTIFKDDIK